MRTAILALLLLFLCVIAVTGFAYQRAGEEERYMMASVERGTITLVVKATGTVSAVMSVDVSSQLSGRIADVQVNFNDEVKAGQVIARIDPESYVAHVNEARAALSVAKATEQLNAGALKRARVAVQSAGTALKIAQAQLAVAQANQQEVEREFQRNLKLSPTKAVSDREFTQSRTALDASNASLREAQEQVNMKAEAIEIAAAELSMSEANLANAQAVVEQRQATLDQAEVDLERTQIRAPIDGVVIDRAINPGQTVAVSLDAKTLFKIAKDLREMEVHGKIDEADVGQLRLGQPVTFTVDAFPDKVFLGRVLQIRKAPEVAQGVVTYTAVISAANPDQLLFPGMTARLRIVVDEAKDVLKIPFQALRFRTAATTMQSGTREPDAHSGTVWVIGDKGSPLPVRVALGKSDDVGIELVSGGLSEGDRVIVGAAPMADRTGLFALRWRF
jgi:HlyD family secretion protein